MAENDYGLPEEITLQSVFDKVSIHLLKQGRPSMRKATVDSKVPICLYRSQDGSACAVGCLISDEDYNANFESQSAESIVRDGLYGDDGSRISNPFPISMQGGKILEMMIDLQVIHDHASVDADGNFVQQHLCGHLARVASRFKLDATAMWDVIGGDW